MFEPGLEIGQILKNTDIMEIFKCGNMGGMRRSKATNSLVIISDYTKGIYHDKWIGGVLHYTGMGKKGDQDINWAQNATLASCGKNGIDVHLFEVMNRGEYIYCGRIELVDKPYTDIQPDEEWIEKSGCFLFALCRTTTLKSRICLCLRTWMITRRTEKILMKNTEGCLQDARNLETEK